jgi:AraC family transcriptional regulator
VLRVCQHIEAHLDEPISLDRLAAVACFSPFHFHRIFRALVGESVMEHVRRLRLERAALRLRSPGATRVIDVALDAGYETHEAFTRAFRAMFGVAPTGFRRARRRPVGARPAVPAAKVPARRDGLSVRLERLPAIRAAFMRHVGPYTQVGPTFERLLSWAGSRGLPADPDAPTFGLTWDDPDVTAPERLRYDACVPVPESIGAEGEVGIHLVPAREYAAVTYRGPYEGLDEVYRWLCGAWPPRSGREVSAAPCLEFYRNDPRLTPPAELLTDVFLPLEPAGRG